MRDRPQPRSRAPRQDQGFHAAKLASSGVVKPPEPEKNTLVSPVTPGVHSGAGRARSLAVEGILSRREAATDQGRGGVGTPVDQERQFLALGGVEVAQHERGRIHPAGGGAEDRK